MRFRSIAFPLCLAACLATTTLAAQPAKPGDELGEARRALFAEAIAAMEAKDWATCRVKALGVYSQIQHPQVAALLGLCEEQLNMHAEAAQHLDHYKKNDDGSSPARTADVVAALDRVRTKVGILVVTASEADAEIYVDDARLGATPAVDRVYLAPGRHVVEARKAGFVTDRREIDVAAATEVPVAFTLKPDTGTTPPPPPEGGKSIPVIVTGAVIGGAGVIAGAVLLGLGAAANGERSDILESLGGSSPCGEGTPHTVDCAEVADLVDRYKTFTIAGGVTLGVGGAIALATLLYGVIPEAGDESPPKTSLYFVPIVSPNAAGAVLYGAW